MSLDHFAKMKKIMFVLCNDKQMTEIITITSSASRPFGILSNAVLPVRSGSMSVPSVEHFLMASLLTESKDQAVVSSFLSLDEARSVFNRLDEKQFLKIVIEACNKFQEKKCRSVAKSNNNKTIGAACRELLQNSPYLIYGAQGMPMQTTLGGIFADQKILGYDLVGHSLMRMKRLLRGVEIPEGLELIFWRMNPAEEDIVPLSKKQLEKQYREFRPNPNAPLTHIAEEEDVPPPRTTGHKRPTATAVRHDEQQLIVRERYEDEDDVDDFLADLEMMRGDEEEEEEMITNYGTDNEEEDVGHQETEEEEALPDPVVPIYTNNNKKVRWVPTHIGPMIDDLRQFDTETEMLYTRVAQPRDPFQKPDPLNTRTDPMTVFKIFKVAEHLVLRMHNGYDILSFQGHSIDAILWECGILPEVFVGKKMSDVQRHQIFSECWDRFKSKTLSYYEFVEAEIIYPGNIVGFIRKAYASKLNFFIGRKIKDILFREFLVQVMEKSFPDVSPDMRATALVREWRGFTHAEFEEITNDLYHLFFAGKFKLSEEDKILFHSHESQRISKHEIDMATAFVPITAIPAGSVDVRGTILDPVHPVQLTIDGKEFHDLFQYLYFQLFQVYGGVSAHDAYEHLRRQGQLIKGDDPLLSQRLSILVDAHRKRLMEEGMKLKLAQYTQVEEILLYLKATGKSFRFLEPNDEETPLAWSRIPLSEDFLPIMEWVVSFIPESLSTHFERSIFLFFFFKELFRSLGLFSGLMGGQKLTPAQLQSFLHCFYKHLLTIASGAADQEEVEDMPPFFWEETKKFLHKKDALRLWSVVFPFAEKFQLESMVPSDLFMEAKKLSHMSMEDTTKAFANVLRCMYEDVGTVSNDVLHTIVMIMSGQDAVAPWSDPVSEMVLEREKTNLPPKFNLLPKEIRDKIPVKKGKKVTKNVVQLYLSHPEVDAALLQHELDRPSTQDAVVARASYAIASLHKHMLHPRRIMFYL